jgi:hypothetical protein
MSGIKFQSGAVIFETECGADYPAGRNNQIVQVSDRTAAGVMQVETLGIHIEQRTLSWSLMPLSEYTALLDFFLNAVNAGEKTFEFTDERGRVGTVRFTSSKLNFRETSFQRFAGSFTLEYIQ